ncbi:HdeD family acid-resistance protein [Dinghuibacter silviterrae]|uniref:Uncharacterized membrane protein HdeD (DUF308 family) n=1 Tax=Dinghuibacter silviterrae TaxID=1539049 RepID=A0A4R8DHN4_9BACT|nr:DUF308 domain-containing protein [Dinghuibacter silviterrae]TDW96968.1 uncharacterized membrane protein HdeD (DUF308 family) [Dinghuibacter silviterrae]
MSIVSNAVGTIKNWWWFVIKGILFLAAGVAIFMRPAEGYVGLSILFSIVMLGVGITQVSFATGNKGWLPGWGWTLASGIIDIVIGIYLLAFPVVTMATLPFFVGFWLMFRSFYIMGASIDLDNYNVPGWGWLLAGGILLLILSVFVIYYPAAAVVGIIACSGSAFIVAGILSIALAFRLRDIKQTVRNLA